MGIAKPWCRHVLSECLLVSPFNVVFLLGVKLRQQSEVLEPVTQEEDREEEISGAQFLCETVMRSLTLEEAPDHRPLRRAQQGSHQPQREEPTLPFITLHFSVLSKRKMSSDPLFFIPLKPFSGFPRSQLLLGESCRDREDPDGAGRRWGDPCPSTGEFSSASEPDQPGRRDEAKLVNNPLVSLYFSMKNIRMVWVNSCKNICV